MPPDDLVTLNDILQAAYGIRRYLGGLDEELFVGDDKTQSAVLYQLTIIGEAANRVSQSFQQAHPEIPWHDMIGMRNILVHKYDKVLLPYVWEAATASIDELINAVEPILKTTLE